MRGSRAILSLLCALACLAGPTAAGRAQPDEAAGAAPAVDLQADPLALHRLDPGAQDLPLVMVSAADGSERRAAGRMLLQGSREVYVRSAAAALAFKAARLWQGSVRRLTFRVGEHAFQTTVDSRLVMDDQGEILLPVPVLMVDGDVWLPITFFTDVVGPAAGIAVSWDADARRLEFGSRDYNLVGLRIEQLSRATAVHLRGTVPLSFRAESVSPGHIALKVYGGEVDPAAVASGSSGLVRRIYARQYADHAMVHVMVDELVDRYRTYSRDEGREIVLVLEEENVAALPEPVPHGRVNLELEGAPVDVTRAIDVRTVVIDPGHGGVEVGKEGPDGILEKNVNLAVAEELARRLEREGLRVVLTRSRDVQLGLDERTEIANRAGGDLFLSLHCNGWFNDSAHGIETYFLSPAKTEYSRDVAEQENAGAGNGDVDFIVWDLVQNRFISASSDLAEVVQTGLVEALDASDRGVRQAGFRVLVGAYMPAVLVEMGFLSNPGEARRLGERSQQRRIAAALADAVLRFKARYARTASLAGGKD